jgi:SAM-dependent methyltransferase
MSNIEGHEIDTQEFWKKRLVQAKQNGTLHYSVYLAKQSLWDRLLKAHLKVIGKLIDPSDSILDAGCGYGRMSTYFPNYLGIDLSPDFIEEALKLYPDKKFEVQDLRKLPYENNQFDWGLVVSIKHMIIGNMGAKAWKPMEKELKRVCKKVLILEYGEMESDDDTEESHAKYEIL